VYQPVEVQISSVVLFTEEQSSVFMLTHQELHMKSHALSLMTNAHMPAPTPGIPRTRCSCQPWSVASWTPFADLLTTFQLESTKLVKESEADFTGSYW